MKFKTNSNIVWCVADITGGGIIFNETKLGVAAGVNWLHDARSDVITWNCFVEGNVAGALPWSNWKLTLQDATEIGFEKDQSKWGFITGESSLSIPGMGGSPGELSEELLM